MGRKPQSTSVKSSKEDDKLAFFAALVQAWAEFLEIDEHLTVEELHLENGLYAQVRSQPKYLKAAIAVDPVHRTFPVTENSDTALHELIHVILAPLVEFVQREFERQPHQATLQDILAFHEETLVTRLSRALNKAVGYDIIKQAYNRTKEGKVNIPCRVSTNESFTAS